MRTTLVAMVMLCAQAASAQTISGFAKDSQAAQLSLEQQYLNIPSAENLERYLLQLTEDPHIAGSPASKQVAEYINAKYQEWGLQSELVEYEAYLPYPNAVELTLLQPDSIRLNLQEPVWPHDKDSFDERAVMPFNAYSPSGDVTAQVVYVNRGLRDDYDALEELGVDAKGRIALVRYGGSFRGVKAKLAEEHGAIGLIIYSDPEDDGFRNGDPYPFGPMRHEDAVQRGSLLYIFKYAGDPLTPGFAATKNAKRLSPAQAENMPRIPTTPISYGQARLMLENLAGPEVPNGWQGALPFRYHVGPGPAQVRLKLDMDYQVRPIYNVIARIPGSEQPDKEIIIGNHHDAWVHGAVDPNSGTAVVMEIGRALAELVKTGWQPRRSIVIGHWDAEEYGLIGSTEWVEEHKQRLVENAVLYLNIDAAVSGEKFGAGAVPSLDGFVQEVVKGIEDPTTGKSVFERWWARDNKKAYKKAGETLPDTAKARVGRLGSGSDYTAFLQHAGIPSVSMGFRGRYGVYHSILDNFFWMKSWGDPTFKYHETMSKIGGVMVLRVAQADILPFDYANYATAIEKHIDDLEKSLQDKFTSVELDFTNLRAKVADWKTACEELNTQIVSSLDAEHNYESLNSTLLTLERALTNPKGLPGREWFKHRIYAPGTYTGYAAKPLAGIAEPAEKEDWQAANQELQVLMNVLDSAIQKTRTLVPTGSGTD